MRFKLIDLDEFSLVVMVRSDGTVTVSSPSLCDGVAADVLRSIAAQLEAAHPPYPCHPAADAAPLTEAPETLGTGGGRYDADRHVWTDGAGHAWDLSVTWAAAGADPVWEWAREFDRSGTPVMQTVGDPSVREALDVLRVLYGPIAPTTGRRA